MIDPRYQSAVGSFCLLEVCFVWGRRSLTLAQVVIELADHSGERVHTIG
jgi:hypothetical protein